MTHRIPSLYPILGVLLLAACNFVEAPEKKFPPPQPFLVATHVQWREVMVEVYTNYMTPFGIRLERSSAGDGVFVTVLETAMVPMDSNHLLFFDEDVEPGQTYVYRVTAISLEGVEADPVLSASVTLPDNPPDGVWRATPVVVSETEFRHTGAGFDAVLDSQGRSRVCSVDLMFQNQFVPERLRYSWKDETGHWNSESVIPSVARNQCVLALSPEDVPHLFLQGTGVGNILHLVKNGDQWEEESLAVDEFPTSISADSASFSADGTALVTWQNPQRFGIVEFDGTQWTSSIIETGMLRSPMTATLTSEGQPGVVYSHYMTEDHQTITNSMRYATRDIAGNWIIEEVSGDSLSPQILKDAQGRLHLTWVDVSSGDNAVVMYAIKETASSPWEKEVVWDYQRGGNAFQTRIGLDGEGRPILGFSGGLARKTTSGWVVTTEADDSIFLDTHNPMDMTVTAGGVPRLTYLAVPSTPLTRLWNSQVQVNLVEAEWDPGEVPLFRRELTTQGGHNLVGLTDEHRDAHLAYSDDYDLRTAALDGPVFRYEKWTPSYVERENCDLGIARAPDGTMHHLVPSRAGLLDFQRSGEGYETHVLVDSDHHDQLGDRLAADTRPLPLVDSAGLLHVFFTQDQVLQHGTWDNNAFQYEALAGGSVKAHSLSGVVTADDVLHVAWVNAEDGSVNLGELHGGTWSSQVLWEAGEAGFGTATVLDPQGHAAIAFCRLALHGADEVPGALFLASDDGDSWTVELVDDAGEVGAYPSLAFAPDGTAHLSYYGNAQNVIRHSFRSPAGWTLETVNRYDESPVPCSVVSVGADGAVNLFYAAGLEGEAFSIVPELRQARRGE
ncbi:glycoside hydrolase [Myxococcota bacterium]|nr:glycoside hydrolase [Myxococcota bacterium]